MNTVSITRTVKLGRTFQVTFSIASSRNVVVECEGVLHVFTVRRGVRYSPGSLKLTRAAIDHFCSEERRAKLRRREQQLTPQLGFFKED